jgi:hypothetical protein
MGEAIGQLGAWLCDKFHAADKARAAPACVNAPGIASKRGYSMISQRLSDCTPSLQSSSQSRIFRDMTLRISRRPSYQVSKGGIASASLLRFFSSK